VLKQIRKIRRRCGCADEKCKLITEPGNKYVHGHYWKGKKRGPPSEEARKNMFLAAIGKPKSEEHKKNISLGLTGRKLSEEHIKKMMGNTYGCGPRSEETKRKMRKPKSEEHIKNKVITSIKPHPKDEYCDTWRDKEYVKDIRKDYCENANCKKISKLLVNHHIWLDKKRCAPDDVITLCRSCHVWLHRALEDGKRQKVNPKDFIVINRLDYVSYINKKSRKIIFRIEKKI